ncbi:MAG: hypothetical protein QOJ70_3467 [Acidobacteriota bacterium]|jgi:hypothetical protein|nr:hypothetical protein [Acidobacteriota bacterium]
MSKTNTLVRAKHLAVTVTTNPFTNSAPSVNISGRGVDTATLKPTPRLRLSVFEFHLNLPQVVLETPPPDPESPAPDPESPASDPESPASDPEDKPYKYASDPESKP